ncbi:MAG: serine hydrolase [Deltaproteobacteria bacterium]|jgi:D-alanyl-D-alanine endopeptidase (penicillin-binding protein 7)|nr:serine hydrolase [Deltaproteobacteria bacterium]
MVRHWLCLALAALTFPLAAEAGPKFKPLTADGLPNVQSESALIIDYDSGELLFTKNPEQVRAIASTGKIFVALVARKHGIDLEAITQITESDAKLARGGARTRLSVGHGFRNIDLLRAMLIASDNRAPSAIGRAVGLSPAGLIYEMNVVAKELGLRSTKFTDCSGLRGNVSTAKEMAVALQAALTDPILREIMATRSVDVVSRAKKPRRISYRNTNRPLHNEKWDIVGGKTGYTAAAGYCLVLGARHHGRRLGIVFLGAQGKLTRFGDFGRVMGWLASKTTVPVAAGVATSTPASGR